MQTILIQGASRGLGLAFVKGLVARGDRVVATCRRPGAADELRALSDQHPEITVHALDVTDEPSIATAAAQIRRDVGELDGLINVAGVLHTARFGPEKRLEHLKPEVMAEVFAVNAFGPALMAKHFVPHLTHDRRAVFAALSARVGSIGDNGLGGWYAYRASKAALNQFLKTLSIELARRSPHVIVASLHPGTVDTGLSEPFQRRVPPGKLFTTDRAVHQLLEVIDGLRPEDTGAFRAWDGSPIPW